MKNIRFFLSEHFQFLLVKFSIYLNRRVFIMWCGANADDKADTNRRNKYSYSCSLVCLC